MTAEIHTPDAGDFKRAQSRLCKCGGTAACKCGTRELSTIEAIEVLLERIDKVTAAINETVPVISAATAATADMLLAINGKLDLLVAYEENE